jgi:hypothetical protein
MTVLRFITGIGLVPTCVGGLQQINKNAQVLAYSKGDLNYTGITNGHEVVKCRILYYRKTWGSSSLIAHISSHNNLKS